MPQQRSLRAKITGNNTKSKSQREAHQRKKEEKIKILIADNDAIARQWMRTFLEKENTVELISECSNGRMALKGIRRLRPDLVFLDIHLPGLGAFEVIERVGIQNMPVTVLVAVNDNYAVEAFQVNAIDYLRKPFSPERFKKSLSRAIGLIQQEQKLLASSKWFPAINQLMSRQREIETFINRDRSVEIQDGYHQRVIVKSRGRLILLKVDEIDCIEAVGGYVKVRCKGEQHLLRDRLSMVEQKLPADRFVRIHRAAIINIDRLSELHPLLHGDYQAVLLDGTKLTLSRRYKEKVFKALQRPL